MRLDGSISLPFKATREVKLPAVFCVNGKAVTEFAINEFGMKNVIALKPDDNEIPYDYDLCISELGNIECIVDNALVLNGFDEIGMFEDEFINPIYVFIREPAYVEGY